MARLAIRQKTVWAFALVAGFALGPFARADVIELTSGETIEGRLLATGPTRLVFDGPDGHVTVERSAVARVLDTAGKPLELTPAVTGEGDPVGVVRTVEGAVRVRRAGRDLKVSIHGSLAVLREGDELRTGPYGRVSLQIPGGALASARSDAVVRFREGTVALVEGKLRLKQSGGRDALALTPEGRLRLAEGETAVEHLRGRTRLICLSGRAVFDATEGYRVEIPRKHVLDVRAEQGHEPASVSASNTNAWPLRLEYGVKWVSIQPGERVVLLGTPSARPSAPPPAVAQGPAPRGEPAQGGLGRVVRAGASFGLQRAGAQPRKVDQAEARGLELAAGDRLTTDSGELFIELEGARIQLIPGTELALRAPGARGPASMLVSGEASFESQGQATLGLRDGAVGLLRGEASVRQIGDDAQVVLRGGTAGARFGDDVRAELVAPAELLVRRSAGKTSLTVPPAAQALPMTLGMLDLQLGGGKAVQYSRAGERRTIALWNGATLEFMDAIRAQVLPGPSESLLLELEDGSTIPLRTGTYRFERRGKTIVKHLPKGVRPEAAESAPGKLAKAPASKTPRPEPAAPVGQRHVLANGAVVTTRDWGKLVIKREADGYVVVEGPGGDLWVGPRTQCTLARAAGRVTFETQDGRTLRCEQGVGSVDTRYQANGGLHVELFRGSDSRRVIEVEARTEFDVTVRRDRYVLAFVFGQAVYLEPGQHMNVSQASGLRTYMAAERSGR